MTNTTMPVAVLEIHVTASDIKRLVRIASVNHVQIERVAVALLALGMVNYENAHRHQSNAVHGSQVIKCGQ
jgi:hypothetical protein